MKTGPVGRLISIATWLGALFLVQVPAQADDPAELVVERIHSNLPLYTFDWEDIWPRSFSSGDEFGCATRVAFGDWHFSPAQSDGVEEEFWERYSNYGAFHCAANIRTADERSSLDEAGWEHGFFVRLGMARLGSEPWEVWALQKGMVPGSDYILLAREAGQEGLIERFRVLQQHCPPGRILEAEGLDVWSTRYCAINSRAELLALGRRMLRLPPRGTIARAPEAEQAPGNPARR